MKATILLLCLMSFAPLSIQAQKYKHKSEAEIAAMTPAQRVNEWVNEQEVHHRFDLSDDQGALIRKYVTLGGIKAMPRLNENQPSRHCDQRNYKNMNNYRFSVIVEKDADGYFASCNELQGCYTQGETYEEVIENIKDAISLHVEDRIEAGEEIRQSQAVSLTLMDLAI